MYAKIAKVILIILPGLLPGPAYPGDQYVTMKVDRVSESEIAFTIIRHEGVPSLIGRQVVLSCDRCNISVGARTSGYLKWPEKAVIASQTP